MATVSNPYVINPLNQNYTASATIGYDLPATPTVLMEQNCNVGDTKYNGFTVPRGCHVVQVFHRNNTEFNWGYTLTLSNTDNDKVWCSGLASGSRIYIGVTPGKRYNLKIQTHNHACIIYYSAEIESHSGELYNTDY